jgi:CBS domain-containing protein
VPLGDDQKEGPMPTVIRDLMSTPPVQAGGDDTLASVARRMADANIGSVPSPDVLGPEEEAEVAWSSLSDHHYRHLPVM